MLARPVQGAVQICAACQSAEAARARANVVLYRMLDAGFISRARCRPRGEPGQDRRTRSAVTAPTGSSTGRIEETLDVIDEQSLTNEYVIEVQDHDRRRHAEGGAADHQRQARHEAPAYRGHPGGTGRHDAGRRDPGDRRRQGLRGKPVQPRHRCAAPARLVVQALRLSGGAQGRLSSRTRSCSTGRSRSATGRRRTTR